MVPETSAITEASTLCGTKYVNKTYNGMYARTETAFVPSRKINALMASSDIPQDSVFILVALASMSRVMMSMRSKDTSTMIQA